MESFQAPKSCPGRGAKAISLEEVDGGVRCERVGIQMELERSTLDQICEAPDKILAHEGLLCKTRDEARVSPHSSLEGPGKTQGQSHPELPCPKETQALLSVSLYRGRNRGQEKGTDGPKVTQAAEANYESNPGFWLLSFLWQSVSSPLAQDSMTSAANLRCAIWIHDWLRVWQATIVGSQLPQLQHGDGSLAVGEDCERGRVRGEEQTEPPGGHAASHPRPAKHPEGRHCSRPDVNVS